MPGNYYYLPQPYNDALTVYDLDLAPDSDITTLLQAALDNASLPVVRIMKPGTYYISPDTSNPYQASSRTCLTITRDDVHLEIGPGVTLKMTANTQTDANGICYGIVFRSRDNIWIGGGGTIDMNAANQSGWTGVNMVDGEPYGQEYGGCIRGYHNTSLLTGNTNIRVENLTTTGTYGNPVNIYTYNSYAHANIFIDGCQCFDCGEGFQIVGANKCGINNCVLHDVDSHATGDGYEFSVCNDFTCTNNFAKGYANTVQGSAVDVFSSRNGVITDNIFQGWKDGIGLNHATGEQRCANLTFSNNVFRGFETAYAADAGCILDFANNWWIDINVGTPCQTVDNPWRTITSATAVGTTVTVTLQAQYHGFQTGDLVAIQGANQSGCNGTFKITRVSSTVFTYTASSAPGVNPTGTIQCRPGLTSITHTNDTWIRCGANYWVSEAVITMTGCSFIGGTSYAHQMYTTASGDKPLFRSFNCRYIRNALTAIVADAQSTFAPEAVIIGNEFIGNGGTIAGVNSGEITLFVIKDNIGHEDPAEFTPAALTNVESWYREGHSLFQDTAKVTPALNTGDPVRVWGDSLGVNPDFVAPSAGTRPTIDSGGGIVSNGTQYMETANTFNADGPYTVIINFKAQSSYPYTDKVFTLRTGTETFQVAAFQSNTAYFYANVSTVTGTMSTTPTSDMTVAFTVSAAGAVTLYEDDAGTVSPAGTVAEDPTSYLQLLRYDDGGTPTFGYGPVRNVVIVRGTITTTDMIRVQRYFAAEQTEFNRDYWSLTNIPDVITTAGGTITGDLEVMGQFGVGSEGTNGHIDLYDDATDTTIEIDAISGGIQIGGVLKTAGTISPQFSDGAALGTSALMFSDLFLASGGVINWNNGDVTATHSANTLAFAGASSGYTFDAKVTGFGFELGTTNTAVTYGLEYVSTSLVGIKCGGAYSFYGDGLSGGLAILNTSYPIRWTTNTYLYGPSSGVLAQRNSTTAQTYHCYGTYTNDSNYVRASLSCNGTSSVTLAAETAGTGSDDVDVNITPAGTGKVKFPSAAVLDFGSGDVTVTHSTNTLAFAGASSGYTFDAPLIDSVNGAASTPPIQVVGTWFSGGTSTTTKPQLLVQPTGTTSTGWHTGGTGLGINAASGFAGCFLDMKVAGTT